MAQPSDPVLGSGEASFEGLGDLEGGEFYSYAHAVSADGSTVVGYGTTSTGIEAYRWENGVMESLGILEGGCNAAGQCSEAWDVSADGSVVVGTGWGVHGEDSYYQAFRWEDGVMEGIPDDRSIGHWYLRAYGVSADGSIVVGQSLDTELFPQGFEAFRWEGGKGESLGFLEEGDDSWANAVSADGSVVIGTSNRDTNPTEETFRWENDEMEGIHEEVYRSFGWDVSADGTTIVGTDYPNTSPLQWEAFRWKDGIVEWLGDLDDDDLLDSEAFAVSADGSVIVGDAGYNSDQGRRVFIWTEKEGMRDLKEVLENDYGLNLTGWNLGLAYDVTVTPEGTVVVGVAGNPDGNAEAFRAVLPYPSLPAATVMPEAFAFGVPVGGSDGDTLTIGNAGGAELEWSIIEAASNCETSSEVAWLNVAPATGTTAPDESEETIVTVDAEGLEPDDYAAFLCMTTNDPIASLVGIPVTMTVEGIGTEATPEELADKLGAPGPNPVNGTATFTLAVENGQNVSVEVFDVTGRRVQTVYEGALAAGMSETLTLDTAGLPDGVYVIRATGEDFTRMRRVTVIR